ncbi:unnamed protein product [Coregonus sp. 'balchen']|nr:unnamed protein product [Coregonus sp. 'balchen']
MLMSAIDSPDRGTEDTFSHSLPLPHPLISMLQGAAPEITPSWVSGSGVDSLAAGASSMWASCCGLLNEVMGTGTVRGQQTGFGAGAGPFRFAPSAGYSTYPPTSSGSAGQLCKACGLAFSVFRRKRPQLMALRVKDLRQYLLLRNIPTDTCREKEDLVDLVLCHQEAGENTSTQGGEEEEEEEEEEEDADTDSLHSLPHSLHSSPPSAARRSASEQSALSASQGDAPLSRSDSSGTAHSQV